MGFRPHRTAKQDNGYFTPRAPSSPRTTLGFRPHRTAKQDNGYFTPRAPSSPRTTLGFRPHRTAKQDNGYFTPRAPSSPRKTLGFKPHLTAKQDNGYFTPRAPSSPRTTLGFKQLLGSGRGLLHPSFRGPKGRGIHIKPENGLQPKAESKGRYCELGLDSSPAAQNDDFDRCHPEPARAKDLNPTRKRPSVERPFL